MGGTHPIPSGRETRTRLQVRPILVETRELRLAQHRKNTCAFALPSREPAQVVLQTQPDPRQERHDRDIRRRESFPERPVPLPLRQEERLDVLQRRDELLGVAVLEHQRDVGGDQLGGDGVDEETRLGALDGVGGEDVGGGKEVGDEFNENEGFGELDGFWRGLVGWHYWATVRYSGDLWRRVAVRLGGQQTTVRVRTLPAGLTLGKYHSGLFERSISYLVKVAFASASAISVCVHHEFNTTEDSSKCQLHTI